MTQSSVRRVRLLRALLAGAAVLAATGVALYAMAGHQPAVGASPPPRLVKDSVTNCAGAGLSGSILFGAGDSAFPASPQSAGTGSSPDKKTLNVIVNTGYTASGIVVMSGPQSNVNDGPFAGQTSVEGLTSPHNAGGAVSDISGWFVCGAAQPEPDWHVSKSPSPSPSKSKSPSPSPSPSKSKSKSPSPSPSPSKSKSPSPSPSVAPTSVSPTVVPSGPPKTGGGGSQNVPWFGALSLLVAGVPVAAALYLRRRDETGQN